MGGQPPFWVKYAASVAFGFNPGESPREISNARVRPRIETKLCYDIAMTDLNVLLEFENRRRAHVNLPPLSKVAALEHAAQQICPCCVCASWHADRARSLITAAFLGLVDRKEVLALFQRGLCCKGIVPAFTFEPAPTLDVRR
jgi:hypothetical protein